MPWNLVGQEKALGYLRRSLTQGSLPHALLLVGPPQTGKGTLALQIAQAVNCAGADPPCGVCSSCRRIAEGKQADVTVIALSGSRDEGAAPAERDIGIERVRSLQHAAALQPFEGRYRVFIIDGAEALSHEAANALLKVLEEPGPQVVLILTAVDEEGVLPTVRSRCQRLALRPAPVAAIASLLEADFGLAHQEAAELAREARGRIGWAVSAARDPDIAARWRQRWTAARDLVRAGLAARFRWASEQANDFGRRRADVLEGLEVTLDLWHDALLLQAGCAGDLVGAPEGRDELGDAVQGLTVAEILGALRAIRAARSQLERNANPRLALEVLALDLPTPTQGRPGA